jgi:serine/threonine protein kinase
MAPESLREKIYSKKSDVWMFGILGIYFLTEFFLDVSHPN